MVHVAIFDGDNNRLILISETKKVDKITDDIAEITSRVNKDNVLLYKSNKSVITRLIEHLKD
ncbi:hypothetical protein [Megamonas hypermegale]|uniref:hypothetical protein n=1 Tax=Megamonas hypermegale TaxID=158847 RepID=UPI0026EE976E|nr:hypothetical protein [Megamonas hypermegale]